MNKNLFYAVAVSCCLLSWSETEADDRSELASYLEAHEANWSAIQTMDVLCRTDRLGEPGVDAGFTETMHERLAFDSVKERYTYAKTIERRLIGKEEIAESVETGFIIRDGMYRTFAVGKRSNPPQPIGSRERVFDEHHMPDWRILIFMSSSRGSSHTWTQKRSNISQVLPQRAATVRKISLGQDAVGFETFDNNGSGYQHRFRDEDLMPSRVVWLVKGELGTTMEVGKEYYEWKQVNKVLVPDTVEGTYRERQFRMAPEEQAKLDIPKMTPDQISELYVDVMIHRDMQFTWLKVNSVLADDLFKFALIDDPAQFTALCAPAAASNASAQE